MTTVTVNRAFESLKFVIKNIDNISPTNRLEMANNVNREIRDEYLGANANDLLTETTLSVANGNSTQSLPSDFQDINPFQSGFFMLDSNGKEIKRLPVMEQITDVESCFIIGDTINFYNIGTSNTIKLKYINELADFTALTETFVVDSRWLDVIRAGLLVQYYIFDKNRGKQIEAQEDYGNLLTNFTTKIPKVPRVMVLPFRGRGRIRPLQCRNL